MMQGSEAHAPGRKIHLVGVLIKSIPSEYIMYDVHKMEVSGWIWVCFKLSYIYIYIYILLSGMCVGVCMPSLGSEP